jgi:V/A-type H+-transporting ATPase subunit C
MTGKGFGYAYTNTRVRVMKSKLIDPIEYSKLMKMSLDQIARYLQETDYKKEIDLLGTKYEEANLIEYAINQNLANSFKKILNFSLKDSRKTINFFLKKYDVWNIKTILRGKQSKENAEEIIQDLIPAGELKEEFLIEVIKKTNSVQEAIESFKKTSYYETLKKHASNLTELEDALDIEYHNLRVNSTSGKIKELFREKALYLDALNAARAKETKIKMKNILQEKKNKIVVEDIKKSRIELRKRMSEKGRKMVHIFKRDSSPVIGYFIAKENEVDNLRIIARGKQANLPLELIEQQLVY